MGIEIIGKLTQKNNGDFKLVDLADVDYDGTGKSAKQELENKIEEAKNSSTPYDDTEIKTDINNIKTDLGTATLNTTAKDVKGAINELNEQCKKIVSKDIYQFDCVETMKSYNLKENEVCETLGFYKNSNLGGAKYIIQEMTDQNIDGYSNILLNNGKVASLSNIHSVNVYQFGAKGDGVTDDTNAIQSALNIANHVYLQEGIFCITNLAVHKYNTLIGSGVEKFTEAPKEGAEFVFKNYLKCIGETTDPAIVNDGTIQDVNVIGNSHNEFVIQNADANLINISIHKGQTALKQFGNSWHTARNIHISWPNLDGIYFDCADSIFSNIHIIRCGRNGISGNLAASSISLGRIEYCYENCIDSNYFTQVNISNLVIDTAVKYLVHSENIIDKVCFNNCIFIGGNLNNDEAYDSQIYLRKHGGGPMFNGCRFIRITAGKTDADVTNLKYCVDCDMTNQPNTFYNCCGYTSNFTSFFKLERESFKTSLVYPINK